MGKKFSGRRGGGSSLSQSKRNMLLRRVDSFKHFHSSTLDEIVDHLRSSYPDYKRSQLQPFTRFVQQTLDSTPRRPKNPSLIFDDECGGTSTSSRKKPKKGAPDESEERLRRLEEVHVARIRQSGQDSSSESEEPSSSEEGSGESDEVTSEDAVYGEQMEPKFDLMKAMLRESYKDPNSATAKSKVVEKEKNIEMELPDREKVGFSSDGRAPNRLPNESKKEAKGSSSVTDVEVKGNDGPRFKDLGGMKEVLEELEMEVIVPLYHPQLPRWLGVRPMAGILLHGPPGCGKTKLAHAIANETGVPFYKISATEIVSGVSGASEENIRELFLKAQRTAPSIVFIDEIDAIASKRENLQREMERRIVTQLMTCMDESHRLVKPTDENTESQSHGYVLVIGATNRPDAVDSALRRPGRFDREIVLGVPDENARAEILSVLTRDLRVEGSFDLLKIARATPGFVGADLAALANKAGNLAMKRILDERKSKLSRNCIDEEYNEGWWKEPWLPEEMERLNITMADFEESVKLVQPSSRREGFSAIPNVKWEDVGGLDLLRQEFDRYVVRRIKHPEEYEGFGVELETGFLLYGPPGCGKTLIAKAVANEAGANFIHIKGPELLNKYVGESELAVRTLFRRARTCSPCILFFDEVDALTTKRGREGGWVVERLLNQLLIELDGADQRRGVFVIGATNRPEVMDNALLRPGRFGKLLYVPLPSSDERGSILKALARKKPVDASVDLNAIGRMEACENFSGADLSSLVNEAAMAALEEKLTTTEARSEGAVCTIKTPHFELALTKLSPSVNVKQKQYYKILSESFQSG
ncbi:cell division control protein 48 homolog C-like [Humulus lupulus]|uniref:cell division control protein 48 homolog C-like n=1 Tax=Humulus lupulus TaxID=3486 RepID=UPI002B40A271|nr:cell division control protein 48 homolog C-like [Humulus lupulus]